MANQQGEAYISAEDLRRFVTALFENAGLPSADAFTVADCLVLANVRGVDTHGVFRVSTYLKRLRKGLVAPCPDIRITPISQAIASIDGSDGMGAVVGMKAMTECIKLGCETGLGLVSVKRGTHYGMAAYYVLHAVENGMIGMAFTNASPALPPWGGRAPFFGTSPLAVGVPSGTQPDYILDMAMSVLARGNVYIAAEKEASISAGLAYDADGHPTTDPRALIENGTMLPFGGVKGAALSMLMDILGGVLSGANFGGEVGNPHMNY
jgi:LDH2 family malate/lactate/ureidoglycolate dehydrogenase